MTFWEQFADLFWVVIVINIVWAIAWNVFWLLVKAVVL